jgi:hypothetical protein
MKRLFLVFSVAVATMFASCSTTQVLQTVEHMESSTRILDGEQKMLINPIIVDLEVSETKVSYTETEAFANFPVTQFLVDNYMATFKSIAISHAAKAHNADVLVGVSIDVLTKNNRLVITVSGYPAHYTKFRNAKKEDVELIKEANAIRSSNSEELITTPKVKAKINQ